MAHDSLSKTKPLTDPVRVIASVLLMVAALSGMVTALEQFAELKIFALLLGLAAFLVGYCFVLLFLPEGRCNVLYLRAFRTDKEAAKFRMKLSAILGREYRISGIRSPRERSSVFLRFLLPAFTALRYAGSKFMDLEAGEDWLARLWKTYQTTRFIFIDMRDMTPNVFLEIKMSLYTMGAERCVFLVDGRSSFAAWREQIESILGPHQELDSFQLLDADDPQIAVHLIELVRRLPAGYPREMDPGRRFVLASVSQTVLAKSRRISFRYWFSAAGGIVLLVIISSLPDDVRWAPAVPLAALVLIFIPRAFYMGAVRVRQLREYGHRVDAMRSAVKLAFASLPYVGFVALTLMIPSMKDVARRAQEISAINSLRVISSSEEAYHESYPSRGFACQLAQLGGTDPQPSADRAVLIPEDLASGVKAGYRFAISCTPANASDRVAATGFEATAVPQTPNKIQRGLCIDENSVITTDQHGGSHCTEALARE